MLVRKNLIMKVLTKTNTVKYLRRILTLIIFLMIQENCSRAMIFAISKEEIK
jgi:hypothetical protein